MFVVAGDLGYRFTKGVNGLHKEVVFPSVVGAGFQRRLSGILGGAKKGVSPDNIHVIYKDENGDKQRFFIGEMALRELADSMYPFDKNKIYHESTKAIIAALVLLLAPSDGPLCFASGLPYKFHAMQVDEFDSFLRSLDFEATFVHDYGDVTRRIKFDDVLLLPQGVAAVIYAGMKHPGLLRRQGDIVGLIDIGGRTTELILYEDNSDGLMLLEGLSDTLELGTTNVDDRVYEAYYSCTGNNLSDAKLSSLVMRGYINHDGCRLDFYEDIANARKTLADNIINAAKRKWKGIENEIRHIIFAGGGSHDLRMYLNKTSRAVTVDNPQFANVCGYHLGAKWHLEGQLPSPRA